MKNGHVDTKRRNKRLECFRVANATWYQRNKSTISNETLSQLLS